MGSQGHYFLPGGTSTGQTLVKRRRLEQDKGSSAAPTNGPQPLRRGRLGQLKARRSNPLGPAVPERQELQNDLSPTNNAITRHLQKHMGEGSKMTHAAADGVLYHTVTNQPLNVDRFCKGYDSDQDKCAEVELRLKQADEQLADVVDMEAIEKPFFALWNQFRETEYDIQSDGAIYLALMEFAKKWGGEVRRMKMQLILLKLLKEVWDNGTIDSDGVYEVLKAYDECDAEVEDGKPHPDFMYARRMVQQAKIGVDYKQAAVDVPLCNDLRQNLDPAFLEWLDAEEELIGKRK